MQRAEVEDQCIAGLQVPAQQAIAAVGLEILDGMVVGRDTVKGAMDLELLRLEQLAPRVRSGHEGQPLLAGGGIERKPVDAQLPADEVKIRLVVVPGRAIGSAALAKKPIVHDHEQALGLQ